MQIEFDGSPSTADIAASMTLALQDTSKDGNGEFARICEYTFFMQSVVCRWCREIQDL